MKKLDFNRVLSIDDIKQLNPPYENGYGWLSDIELSIIDPLADKLAVQKEATFEDGSTYCLVERAINEPQI